ncbi:LysR family transcriptional regulator [Vibrio coralliilyticus]|uniref:LysR family transcriptional regulator n=1 Tax=Vibrio coralliilyticus TaxID=190893 RepID=UPI0005128769|nr:LysR family transcriptional regulator [Vibrio coralliilyticus]AIU67678.1 LysR family transcriptional regulator [Vibrio coralliilyticus]
MAKDLFYNLDLNLLRTFLVLSQELNMRKASQRLFVSQPAISQALQKLRNHFDDELFVKVPKGLEPTAFAVDLANSISPHMDGLSNALNTTVEFSPADINSKLTIALSPIVLACLSGTLFPRLRQKAPNAEIQLTAWNSNTFEDIAKGETLLGINYHMPASKEIYPKHLLDLRGIVFVRQGHPIRKSQATPEDFEGYEIASPVTPGWNDNTSIAAQLMEERGLEAKVGFRSEMMMAIIDVVQHTDMFMPHSNLFPLHHYPSLRPIEVDIDETYHVMPLYSHFHIKNRSNPLILWLHDEIQTVLNQQVAHFETLIS